MTSEDVASDRDRCDAITATVTITRIERLQHLPVMGASRRHADCEPSRPPTQA